MKFNQHEEGAGKSTAIRMCPFFNDKFKPQVSVALSAAVAEVGAALRTCHMIASLRTLDVNLQRSKKDERINIKIVFSSFTHSNQIAEELHKSSKLFHVSG